MEPKRFLARMASVLSVATMAATLSFGQAPAPKPAKDKAPAASAATHHELVDLNAATKEELIAVPGSAKPTQIRSLPGDRTSQTPSLRARRLSQRALTIRLRLT